MSVLASQKPVTFAPAATTNAFSEASSLMAIMFLGILGIVGVITGVVLEMHLLSIVVGFVSGIGMLTIVWRDLAIAAKN